VLINVGQNDTLETDRDATELSNDSGEESDEASTLHLRR
jgi:hypothetical protein